MRNGCAEWGLLLFAFVFSWACGSRGEGVQAVQEKKGVLYYSGVAPGMAHFLSSQLATHNFFGRMFPSAWLAKTGETYSFKIAAADVELATNQTAIAFLKVYTDDVVIEQAVRRAPCRIVLCDTKWRELREITSLPMKSPPLVGPPR